MAHLQGVPTHSSCSSRWPCLMWRRSTRQAHHLPDVLSLNLPRRLQSLSPPYQYKRKRFGHIGASSRFCSSKIHRRRACWGEPIRERKAVKPLLVHRGEAGVTRRSRRDPPASSPTFNKMAAMFTDITMAYCKRTLELQKTVMKARSLGHNIPAGRQWYSRVTNRFTKESAEVSSGKFRTQNELLRLKPWIRHCAL
ncbi:hypothetical protein BDZ90DRAFT_188003 [Jaminaea rosea]|uniref:Uncharacterized protein n=1 Tax=Jaminaea rosea TaxID=1569628 RepID=A0A316UQG6_9BASI|nr:hypothetical protein BDZ90DRAFT_188003 [Jaminaea rosea]PWN27214.1 hypothetical protein BDZ90DRAFT_188003 [Jaminaea rosea]